MARWPGANGAPVGSGAAARGAAEGEAGEGGGFFLPPAGCRLFLPGGSSSAHAATSAMRSRSLPGHRPSCDTLTLSWTADTGGARPPGRSRRLTCRRGAVSFRALRPGPARARHEQTMTTWKDLFPSASEAEWRDWRWQQRNALTTEGELARVVRLTDEERRGLRAAEGRFRVSVTPYYASLMDPDHASCPIRMQSIPSPRELERAPGDLEDPLGEEPRRAARAVVHRYRDRALFLVGDRCAVYCRHCTRRRLTLSGADGFDRSAVEEGLAYVRAHPEVRDVIVSGGDPLVLSDVRLAEVLEGLRAIPHVQLLRVGTRGPVTCPMRVTDALARMLRQFAPLFV